MTKSNFKKNLRKAKQIFWDSACNYFYLERNGPTSYEDFIKFGGNAMPGEQEEAWRKEYVSFWLERINDSSYEERAFSRLIDAEAIEAIPALLNKDIFLDDFVKMWYALTLKDFGKLSKIENTNFRVTISNRVKSICEELLEGKIKLSDVSRRKIRPILDDMISRRIETIFTKNQLAGRLTEEDYVKARTRFIYE